MRNKLLWIVQKEPQAGMCQGGGKKKKLRVMHELVVVVVKIKYAEMPWYKGVGTISIRCSMFTVELHRGAYELPPAAVSRVRIRSPSFWYQSFVKILSTMACVGLLGRLLFGGTTKKFSFQRIQVR